MINRAYRLAIPILVLWLLAWIFLSWAGVQDDAFIHLRYADNFHKTHQVTYDGVHPNYGASSLLYLYLLSFLRALFTSPNLPRAVSTCAHLVLITGLIILFFRSISRDSSLSRLLGLTFLLILVAPSAVRWLDDGMETSLALCFTGVICWATFRQSIRATITRPQYLALVALGFFSVLLRTELILLCGLAFAILFSKQLFDRDAESKQHLTWLFKDSHLLLGGILAIAFIRLKMHAFLPDTALAKSEGVADWNLAFFLSIRILTSSLSFGIGMFFFWILTVFLLLRARRFSPSTFLANLAFPVLFTLAALRGQQIQGARYFVWAFFFSILWNILELSAAPLHQRVQTQGNTLVYCFLALLLLALPYESKMLYPMLSDRATLLKQFEGDHLELLQGKRGVAFDIGYIGYFSRADICDVAGLVNGRDKARQSGVQRFIGCVTSNPDFMFLNQEGLYYVGQVLPLADWQICSRYDFRNTNQNDRHYLVVRRSTAPELCKRIAGSAPSEATALFP